MSLHPGRSLVIRSPQCTLVQLLSGDNPHLPCYKYVQIPGQLRAPGPRQSWGYLSPNLQVFTFKTDAWVAWTIAARSPASIPQSCSQAAASWPRTRRNC